MKTIVNFSFLLFILVFLLFYGTIYVQKNKIEMLSVKARKMRERVGKLVRSKIFEMTLVANRVKHWLHFTSITCCRCFSFFCFVIVANSQLHLIAIYLS